MKTRDEAFEDDNKSWKEDEQGLDPKNTRCLLLLLTCLVPSRVAPTSDHGRKD
jgi:hypothetical protein